MKGKYETIMISHNANCNRSFYGSARRTVKGLNDFEEELSSSPGAKFDVKLIHESGLKTFMTNFSISKIINVVYAIDLAIDKNISDGNSIKGKSFNYSNNITKAKN